MSYENIIVLDYILSLIWLRISLYVIPWFEKKKKGI